jgi:hypothetical protein
MKGPWQKRRGQEITYKTNESMGQVRGLVLFKDMISLNVSVKTKKLPQTSVSLHKKKNVRLE